jgi:CubicO group peptidase (beta-lactamase class C family)
LTGPDPERVLADGVGRRVFSGAAGCRLDRSGAIGSFCLGTVAHGSPEAVGPGTLFDIASLTKVFTSSAVLALVARGLVDLNDPVGEIFPPLCGSGPGKATLEQLLAHEAGFAAWAPFFEAVPLSERGSGRGRKAVMDMMLAHPPARAPGEGAEYSDLGYVVLGEVLRRLTGSSLADAIAAAVTGPLGLGSVRFMPVGEGPGPAPGVAATEDCPWRGRVLVGEAHDDNAWTMGGEEGHAGLFATARDVAGLGVAWLRALKGEGWLPRGLAARAVARRPSGRGLGWDIRAASGSAAGDLMGPRTFGHLGFTGCSLWVDPDAGVSVSLLTNRVHPTRAGAGIMEIRRRFHDAAFACAR